MENLEKAGVVRLLDPTQARVNVTFAGQNGELPDPVLYDAPEADIKGWVTEALRTGGIPGIPASPNADLKNYVLDRFDANEARPYRLLALRPKTEFGGYVRCCPTCGRP